MAMSASPQQQQQPGTAPRSFVTMRSLIPTKQAGLIIGKSGQNVQEIRETTGARVRISEIVAGSPERVVSISGEPDSVAAAYEWIVNKLIPVDFTQPKQFTSTLRLLLPNAFMGALIGKQGSQIRLIQEESHARVHASAQMLGDSSDRMVSVQGVSTDIHTAVKMIAQVIKDSFVDNEKGREILNGHIPYRPSPHHSALQNHHHHNNNRSMEDLPAAAANTQVASQSTQIQIPTTLVGSIIGKAGRRIAEIRMRSGANVRIEETPDKPEERTVTVSGDEKSVKSALFMVYSRIENEKKRQSELNNPAGEDVNEPIEDAEEALAAEQPAEGVAEASA